ncbi:UNVERIFIED_CONTAM: hypothetical protein Sradi_3882100 [Sesamum radiatum]|uniref:Uncharacterized protein n=1 Tax=Sesamum radiatum TaxID=300843 RepID=A0AAW2Q2E8_SESRA
MAIETTSNPVQNKPGGAKSLRSNSNREGEIESPTLRLVHRAVFQENKQGAPQRTVDASYATTRIDNRYCPKKQLLNALATFTDKASPTKPVEPQASASGGNDSKEDEDNLGAISQ